MADNSFFSESLEQSRLKATIITQYFWRWAKIVIPTATQEAIRKNRAPRIAYIDLFAGPGRYSDGTISTPLMILESALHDENMRNMLVTIFNDMNDDNKNSLQREIFQLPEVETLRFKPKILDKEVGEQLVSDFQQARLVPTLFFVDPWGYKGLSLRLINSVLKDWGCDCIFFFNFNRINAGLQNDAVKVHIDALFGPNRADWLRANTRGLDPRERESLVLDTLSDALKEMGGKFILPFRFRHAKQNRTSHHLIFVSKHFKGYTVMKEIMASHSSSTNQGVASFEYNTALRQQPELEGFIEKPLDELKQALLQDFCGRELTMKEIYEVHSFGTPYIPKNYKQALCDLENQKLIRAEPAKRKQGTFGDDVRAIFP